MVKLNDLINRDIPCVCGRTHRCDIPALLIGTDALDKLPVLLEWKSMAEDDYALGLEPATTRFDTFKMTHIGAREMHEYNVNIKFRKI